MNTADVIKKKLNATTKALQTITEKNGNVIVIEKCLIDKKYEVVFIYDDDESIRKKENNFDKVVVIC